MGGDAAATSKTRASKPQAQHGGPHFTLEQPKPCDTGTKKASLDGLHTSVVHGCVYVCVCVRVSVG